MLKPFLTSAVAMALAAFSVAPAAAATISIVSMQYSAAHPVPHLHYEGETVAGDVEALQAVYDQFVHCRTECLTEDGGATAVLTMNGPGGNYAVGLALADFLRANHIATVVERGMQCYSACAFAFLGGTGYSSFDRIGAYVDRMVEPGSIVGFHAPYFDEETLRAALEERSPTEIMGESRSSLSLMVKELVKWNVDPEIVFYMVDMGPEQTYNLVNADDLYLVRTALPPTPTSAWITDIPSAVRNACLRLLAIYERGDPLLLQDRITGPFEAGIGRTEFDGPLSGYRLSDKALDLGHCSVTDNSVARGYDLDVALYMNPGLDGNSAPLLSFFNRQDYFSTAGIGGSPLKRTFQRGGINHWFLPVGVDIDSLDLPGELAIATNKFFTIQPLQLPAAFPELTVDVETATSRISHQGDVWVFEQVGSSRLYDATRAENGLFGVNLTTNSASEAGYVREGTHADGTSFAWFGFLAGDVSAVTRIVIAGPAGTPATPEQLDLMRRVMCATSFAGMTLSCG